MGYNYLIGEKTWEKEKLLVTSNFVFSHNVLKSCLLLMRQNEYYRVKSERVKSEKQTTYHDQNLMME